MRAFLISLVAATAISVTAAPAFAQFYQADPQVALVDSWYQRYLGRNAEPAGIANHVWALRQNSVDVVEAGILASDEYYHRNGCNEAAFVTAVYRDVFGGPPGDVGALVFRLQQLGCNRHLFALEVLSQRGAVQPIVVQRPLFMNPSMFGPPPRVHGHGVHRPAWAEANYGRPTPFGVRFIR